MNARRLLASCFGLGWLPIAPGTWGSLPPAVAFGLMAGFGAPGYVSAIVMALFVVAGSAVCVACVPAVSALAGKADPGEVVVDEVAGQAVTFLPLGPLLSADLSLGQGGLLALLGFLLFRAFDIVKPWPIRKLESLPAGWGVLADDLLAGVFAAVVLGIAAKWWIAA
ncbi:MAG: phosphatidylglycerophosphatase A [Sedimentisphaerales bacterium]|nr:phosphatidylglycerophosphatase A [Sedimentisphaerales bacterium]